MILMALDHVRMYFALGTWYAEPTNLATTTPLLFFTRWITHFCAPIFVFVAGTSAFLYRRQASSVKQTAFFLLTRGLWLIFAELVIVNFAWTFDVTYSLRILQVIWAIGVSMAVLSLVVFFLPERMIFLIGLMLVFGHNLLDPINRQGSSAQDLIWYTLHQPHSVFVNSTHLIDFVYPVLPWIGVMMLGYAAGQLYQNEFLPQKRQHWLFVIGLCGTFLFLFLRSFALYGEPHPWQTQDSVVFGLMSFLNTTKYPPSLQFLLMTLGPGLIFLAITDGMKNQLARPVITFGKVPFFFYILHLFVIHGLAMLFLVFKGHDWHEYILSARALMSGTLQNFGVSLGIVYLIWFLIILSLYPVCRWYETYRASHPSAWWLRYL